MQKKYIIYSVWGAGLIGAVIVLTSWRRKAANVAGAFVNETEIGNNAGFASDAFEKMMKDVGWKGGEAWCMYFAKTVYMQAFPAKAGQIAMHLTGSTQTSWQNAKNNPRLFKVVTSGKPMIGDIVIWQSVTNPSLGHAGIVKRNLGGGDYETIEGNTDQAGVREGQGVEKKKRLLTPGVVDGTLKVLGFIRLRL